MLAYVHEVWGLRVEVRGSGGPSAAGISSVRLTAAESAWAGSEQGRNIFISQHIPDPERPQVPRYTGFLKPEVRLA